MNLDQIRDHAWRELLGQFVVELKSSGMPWRTALHDQRFARFHAEQRWFTDSQKGMFYRLMSTGRRQAFLEIGAGSGIVSACLSEDFGAGYAVDMRQECLDFMEHRFREDAVVNVQILRSDGVHIALPDRCVDLVVMDDPRTHTPDPQQKAVSEARELQLLAEIARCLRPDGRLVIATDNAWDYRQGLLKVVTRAISGSPSQPFSRSYFGSRRRLQRAGFRNARVFVVMPHRHMPIDIYSFHKPALDHLYRKYDARNPLKRVIRWLSGILRTPYIGGYFETGFYVVCDK